MAVKLYKPTSPGRRIQSVTDYSVLSKKVKTPKGLIVYKSRRAGRNNSGKITVRHKGGGARKRVRLIDFSRVDKKGVPANVQTIEYDPTRTAFISLIAYKDGAKRYILTPEGLKVGAKVMYSEDAEITPGNRLALKNIPVGTSVHDVELIPGHGGKIARSAGGFCTLQNIEGGYALLKLPSGEIRKVRDAALASVGQLANADWMNVRIGKAGRSRHMGIRPSVRGKAMNPVDHPHGGGEGVNPIGLKYPKTPWGKHALGVRTRDRKKHSNRMIIQRRGKKK
ncbi:MAG: 50S ribosomal protein L2 [Candidatus Doudnabacteria bacterium CG10_big_fil_rev_8_21_14_0_10_42_18]|uniref:Large ribosomal subunit protein uL2 n=1 Tax=Candidatus Doudnabacteria bacterium CG10_big_fil_rev_8_21_14_0_10_42_18 TaxID=1974552 RepID=A0A2H0VDL6_9BACT|nr:MAG: 50S ribosomal protein L2 [Candidatus Doudnabacteria bacterium CG10_big_fil_rev_8_21_14_0_10_42_18]